MAEEKKVSSEVVYHGNIMTVHRDKVLLPDGREGAREVVVLSDAVTVAALTIQGEVIMVKQYRYPTGQELLELPAGKIEPGESPLNCAKRELEEETGYRAEQWREVCNFFTTPGCCTEKMYLFIAEGLSQTKCDPDQDEFIETVKVPLIRAGQMISNGDIVDAKTIVGLLAATVNLHQ